MDKSDSQEPVNASPRVAIIGDSPEFIAAAKKIVAKSADKPAPPPELTYNIGGDNSHIPPEILAQLESPEAQARIRDLQKKARYGEEQPRMPRWIHINQPGGAPRNMSSAQLIPGREGRKLRRQYFRQLTKAARKGLIAHVGLPQQRPD